MLLPALFAMCSAIGEQPTTHYHPEGLYVWDTWYLHSEGRTHVFHLQVKRPDSSRPDEDHGTIGHAVSDDLLHWEELPTALRRGAPGSYDDGMLFTGYTVEHEGVIYLIYCANHRGEDGQGHQTMCLATSEDGVNFVRHPDNPIIEGDGGKYVIEDCRDIVVLRDPAGEGWLGYVVMRLKDEDPFRSCCIVLCRSRDLIHWEVGDPVCKLDRYRVFEVPEVFQLDGRWYMIALTGNNYGQRSHWSDPNIWSATIVAESDGPEGPFREVQDNFLLAVNNWQGFSARTVEVDGERLMLYTRAESNGAIGHGRLAWPVRLVHRPGGGLLSMYWHGVDRAFGPAQHVPPADLSVETGWTLHPVDDLPGDEQIFMISAKVSLNSVYAAGLAFRHAGNNAYLALLDAANGEVALVSLAHFTPLQRRRWDIQPDKTYQLRIVVVGEMVEVYVDEVLILQCQIPALKTGGVGLFVDTGTAKFSDLKYWSSGTMGNELSRCEAQN